MTTTQTIPLLDQFKASRAIYDKALENVESMSDNDLLVLFGASGSALARLAAVASGSALDRLAAVASDSTLARLAAVASDSTLARLAAVASGSALARLAAVASDSTLARLAAVASDSTLARLAAVASGSALARLAAVASGSALARLAAVASDSTLARLAAVASDSALDRLAALRTLTVPVIPDLDARIAAAVGPKGSNLDMGSWHCGTTHCRAGHAINEAGEAGYALEKALGSKTAGRLIYEASTGRIAPDFFASKDDALADILRCANLSV